MSPAAGTLAQLRAELRAALGASAGAALEADLLLGHVLERPRAWLLAHDRDPVPAAAAAAARALAGRRRRGEPIAYLTGRREFWSLPLSITPAVLVPRAETERLVECALARLPARVPARVCDLGTGSGAVAIAVARERAAVDVTACDSSRDALAVAAVNVAGLAPGRVRLVCTDWLAGLRDGAFDLLVANPPYVAAGDPHLARGDLRHEPAAALVAGPQGLDALARIAGDAPRHLVPGGWLLVEHGADQGAPVRALLARAGLEAIATHRDLAGHERVTEGRRPARAGIGAGPAGRIRP